MTSLASRSTMGTTAAAKAALSTCASFLPLKTPPERLKTIQQEISDAKITPLEPIGAAVEGIDLKGPRPSDTVVQALEEEMAERGFLVFKRQKELSVDQLIEATKWWGGREMHSTHGVHPATPPGANMRHIFRLSNDRTHGILGVGPQWHNDGSFEGAPFSHVAYHILKNGGGGTHFCHQGIAFDLLDEETQEFWSRLSSVNSNSGVMHPVVHTHPISKRKSVWLHMGMTGAVIEKLKDEEGFRLLTEDELKTLFTKYNQLLNDGLTDGYAIAYDYEPDDVVFIDNYAVGHRASPEAHKPASEVGLRIMHRATGKAPFDGFHPHFGLPLYADIHGPSPFGGEGIWIGGGVGFRFDPSLKYQN